MTFTTTGRDLEYGRSLKADSIDPTCQKTSSLGSSDQPSFTSTQSSDPQNAKQDSPVVDNLSEWEESKAKQDLDGFDSDEEYLASLSKLDDDIEFESLVIQNNSRPQEIGRGARKAGWIKVLRMIDEQIAIHICRTSNQSILKEQNKLFEESRKRQESSKRQGWPSTFLRSTSAEGGQTESQVFEALLEDFGGHHMMEII